MVEEGFEVLRGFIGQQQSEDRHDLQIGTGLHFGQRGRDVSPILGDRD